MQRKPMQRNAMADKNAIQCERSANHDGRGEQNEEEFHGVGIGVTPFSCGGTVMRPETAFEGGAE